MKKSAIVTNEKGSAIVVALLALTVLTIIGINSIDTSTIEHVVVRNERIYQDNFYRAESALNEGLERLESATNIQLDDRTFSAFTWLKNFDSTLDWTNVTTWNTQTRVSTSANVPNADYSVMENGIAEGGSLDMAATSHLFKYIARGRAYADGGNAQIEVGYRKRH